MPKMVRVEQISALLDFIEKEPELALGHGSRTNEGRALAKGRWESCANTLNSVSSDCPNKTPAEWRAFYNEYKWKVLKKIKQQKREMNAGGSSAKKTVLTPLQERLFNILRRDNGDPFAGVRHSTLVKLSKPEPPDSQILSSKVSPQPCQVSIEPCVVKVEPCSETAQSLPGTPQSSPGITQACPVTPEPHTDTTNHQPPRRRRLRATRRYPVEESDHPSRAILARLERMENINAEAIQDQAKAINRLAAAIENIGDKIGTLIDLFGAPSSKKNRCTAASTSSESDNIASL